MWSLGASDRADGWSDSKLGSCGADGQLASASVSPTTAGSGSVSGTQSGLLSSDDEGLCCSAIPPSFPSWASPDAGLKSFSPDAIRSNSPLETGGGKLRDPRALSPEKEGSPRGLPASNGPTELENGVDRSSKLPMSLTSDGM